MQNRAKLSDIGYIGSVVQLHASSSRNAGRHSIAILQDLGRRLSAVSVEPTSFLFFVQRLSVTVQRGNAACMLGTVPTSRGLDELYLVAAAASCLRRHDAG
jgi:hypothetical protein